MLPALSKFTCSRVCAPLPSALSLLPEDLEFVGRPQERALLWQSYLSVEAGPGALVVVSGDAGGGKTRLASDLAQRVSARGGTVLYGRCEAGSVVPDQPIAEALLGDLNRKHECRVTDISAGALDAISRHQWPGNVRELRNVLERAVILAGEGSIEMNHLPAFLQTMPAAAGAAVAVPGQEPGTGGAAPANDSAIRIAVSAAGRASGSIWRR